MLARTLPQLMHSTVDTPGTMQISTDVTTQTHTHTDTRLTALCPSDIRNTDIDATQCTSDSHTTVNYDTIPYDTRCYVNVRSKADMSQSA